MKKIFKKIGENKFQFFFFVGLSVALLASLVIARVTTPSDDPIEDDPIIEEPVKPNPDNSGNVDVLPEEVFKLPFSNTMKYEVVRKYYDKNASVEDQTKSLIKYNNSYRTSNGTGYANVDNTSFDVLSVLSGKVLEIKESPLYGKFIVLEHSDGIKTYYYGLSEVTVVAGATVNQGDKIGVSGRTEIDVDAGVHVFLKVTKNNQVVNPESLVGLKISEIK